MLNLFIIFFKIGLFSIGGGYAIIPLIQEQVVNNYHWISANTFTDIITISQMTPGPLAVNTSTFVGIQLAGISGAIVATIGCIFAGATISIILYLLFTKYQKLEIITNILNTLKATSVGLIMSAGATILILTFVENNSIFAVFKGMTANLKVSFYLALFLTRNNCINDYHRNYWIFRILRQNPVTKSNNDL